MRPYQMLLQSLGGEEEPPDGLAPGSRGSALPDKVKEAARQQAASAGPSRRGSDAFRKKAARRHRPPPGGRMHGNTLVIDIDDPGAMAAFNGEHAQQKAAGARHGFRLGGAQRKPGTALRGKT